ncbi:hypothetical protein ILYODFUR_025213 [Ilyodon furcidens]|uniref:Uncharacterized protein n=1 Tax=Ilyodon furcidens TaxID=33524 RepID=A0ABV0V8U9_9TELE
MCPLLDTINQSQSVEKKRDAVISCLIEYLGEKQEALFQDCQVLVIHNPLTEEDPAEVSVVIEGKQGAEWVW